MESSGSSHHGQRTAAAVPAKVKMSAGEIVELLPSLSPGLSNAFLQFLQTRCKRKGILELALTGPDVEGLLRQVCEGFAAELEALLGRLGPVGGGSRTRDVDLLQLSFCMLLALAPSFPDACEINICEINIFGVRTGGGERAVEVLYTALVSQEWSSAVRRLTIEGRGWFGSDRGCEHLANLLKFGHCKLQQLTLSSTATGAGGVRHIARALETNSSLGVLEILHSKEVGDGGVEQLADVLRTNSTLQELTLFGIMMTVQGLRHLCDTLQSTQQWLKATSSSSSTRTLGPGLTKLDISRNEIGVGGTALLGEMLANNRCLRTLRAQDCLREEDWEGHLARGLRGNSSLEELDISFNSLGKVGLGLLVRSLATNRNTDLKTLRMKEVGEMPAAKELANMIVSNHSLLKLDLGWASYSAAEWVTVILPALGHNTTLSDISLYNCPGVEGEKVRAALVHLLRINTTIQYIELYGTPLDKSGEAQAVKVELRRNKEFRHTLSALPRAKPKSCRIALCGHPYAGKTSLLQTMKLLQQDARPTSSFESEHRPLSLGQSSHHNSDADLMDKEMSKRTRGIDIHLLKDEPDLRISVWDLAGQREFHALLNVMFPRGNNSATLFVLTFSPIVSPEDQLRAGQLKTMRDLEEEAQYWLRFIASNSKPNVVAPTAVVVITHKDTLLKVGINVESWLRGAQDIVCRLAAKFSRRVKVQPQPFMVNALASQDAELNRWVKEVDKSLRSTLDGLEDEPAICTQVLKAVQDASQAGSSSPIISKAEFGKICGSLSDIEAELAMAKMRMKDEMARARIREKDDRQTMRDIGYDPELVKAVGDRVGTAVAAYLHDAGEVIHHSMLDIVVSNPKWFCQGVLGQLIDLFPSSSSKSPQTPKNGLVSKTYLSCLLSQEAMKNIAGLDQTVVTTDQLIQLMLCLNLCYEQTPGDPNTAYFLPALFDDEGNKAGDGERPLTWRKFNTSTFVGRRLQCRDQERTFLTDGFFPCLQVVLHNYAFKEKWVEGTHSSYYMLEKNLFNIWVNGMEIFIEFSGSTGYFVDILVKSTKSHHLTMEFLRPNIINTIRTFCASQEGCQGVTLAEAIIRPDCLYGADGGNPILCTYRRDQSILVEELTEKMKRMRNYEHCWDQVEDGVEGLVLPYGQHSGTMLLKGTKPRGMALIVSMEMKRPGAGVGRGSLEALALACGFGPVLQEVDQEASQLIDTIKNIAKSGILEEDEAFMCSINGHGGTQEGQPYLLDQNNVKVMVIRDIIEPFRRSRNLLGKPKIFFVNCCRGLYDNSSVEEVDHGDHGTHDGRDDQQGGAHDGHDDQQGAEPLLPPLLGISDCLIVFSTSEGCPSCGYPARGTIFVEKLVETVMEKRQTTDVLTMMSMVCERVNEVQNLYVEVRSTLREKLYLGCGRYGNLASSGIEEAPIEDESRFECLQEALSDDEGASEYLDEAPSEDAGPSECLDEAPSSEDEGPSKCLDEAPSSEDLHKDDSGKIGIRQDVSALGFANFDVPFQPGKILCLCKFEALPDDDVVHIYFLHEEGMACLAGVGLTNSVIILRAHSDHIYVRELGEGDWMRMWTTEDKSTSIPMRMWTTEDKSTSIPILFSEADPSSFGEGGTSTHSFREGGTNTHPLGSEETEVNMKEARSPYCYEAGPQAPLKGTSLSMLKGRSLLHGLMRRVVHSMYTRPPGETSCGGPAGDCSGMKNTAPFQPSTTGEGSGLSQPPTSNSSHIEMKKASGQSESAEVTTDNRQGEASTDKFLTVEVIFNPRSNEIKDPETKEVIAESDAAALSEDGVHGIATTMIVKFHHQQKWNELEVSLKAEFQLDSVTPKVKNSAGWCQDDLISSFKCLDEYGLILIDRGIGTPLKHYSKDSKTTMQTTEAEGKGHNWSASISGSAPFVTPALGFGKFKTVAASRFEGVETSFACPGEVLDKSMFTVNNVSCDKGIKYHATIRDTVDMKEMLLDQSLRKWARDGQLLSTFGYDVWGRWKLYTPQQPMYPYQVSVERTLLGVTFCEPQRKNKEEMSFKLSSSMMSLNPWSSKTTSDLVPVTRKLLQQVTRTFLISHTFTYNDYQSDKYLWEMDTPRVCDVPSYILKPTY